MGETLRCGLFGAGMMGRNHARVIRETPGIEFSVLVDPDGDPQNLAQSSPVVATVSDALSLGIDCAIVAVPTRLHEEVATTLADHGIPCLIEKPLAHNSEAGKRIAQAFESSGTLAAVGHIERFNPAVVELRKKLSAGEIGEVFQIATRRQSSYPQRISDVGVALDLASHDVDLTMFISSSTYDYVSAVTTHRSGRHTEDMIIGHGQLESGVIVSHVVNWLSPLKERFTVVSGELGILVADTLTSDLTLHRNGEFSIEWDSLSSFRGVSEGDVTRYAFSKKEPLRAQLEAFIESVRTGDETHIASIQQGLSVLHVIEAMLESSSTRSGVRVDS